MKKLLLLITALLLLVSVEGQILRYSNYTAPPPPVGGNDFLTNLVAYWSFEESSGTIIDSVGSNNSTACTADYGSTGISGNCLSFTRANSDAVTFADADALRMSDQDFTFVAWIYQTDFPASAKFNGVIGGENVSAGFGTYTTTGRINGGQVATQYTFASSLIPDNGTWEMVAVSFDSDATTDNWTYYVSGASETGDFNYDFTSDRGSIYIGKLTAADNYFNGLIDEVMIWKGRTLTTDELDDLYNSGTGLFFADFE